MKNKIKVSVVMPSYNESENIAEAVKRISTTLGSDLLEIIVVDDNSPDKTWKIAKDLKSPKVRVIRRMRERGLASALARGVEESRGNIVVWLDCDLGIPPEDILKLVKKLKYYDVAIGSRYVGHGKDLRPRWRAFLSFMINYFACLVLGFKVRDYTSGFIAVRKEVLEKVKINPHGFGEYFVEFVYKCSKNNFKIVEVEYIYRDRARGISKSTGSLPTLLKYGFQYGLRIIKLRLGFR